MKDKTCIELVACMSRNRVIGSKGQMPWYLSADLKHFKALTLKSCILMGAATYASIGRPLPQRRNLVLSHSLKPQPGIELVDSIEQALELVTTDKLLVIGGGKVYAQTLPLAQRLHLTIIDQDFEGDTFFPQFSDQEFCLKDQSPDYEENGLRFYYQTYERL